MAVAATRVFAMHPEAYSEEARRLLRGGDRPFEFEGLAFAASVEESRAINRVPGPAVIVSAAGMCTAGRVKHHLYRHISDPRSTILFAGFQAAGTLGRLIQDGTDPVRIFGDWLPVRARVETLEDFSAHADQAGLLDWFARLGGLPRRSYAVHGEERAALELAALLRERFGARVEVPRLGESFPLD